MTVSDCKTEITRQNLVFHGISYDLAVYETPIEGVDLTHTSILPDQVDAVREALLNFVDIVPEGAWEDILEEEVGKYGSISDSPAWMQMPSAHAIVRKKKYHDERDLFDHHAEWKAALHKIKDFEGFARYTRELPRRDSNIAWKAFWKDEVFRKFSDEARMRPGYCPLLDDWSLRENIGWNEFYRLTKPVLLLRPRPQPNPDVFYAFPFRTVPSKDLKGLERDEVLQSFSMSTLRDLVLHGVSCAPTECLRKWVDTPDADAMASTGLCCFPWAVVEIGEYLEAHHNLSELCYCRAANAAAAALEIQAQLFEQPNHYLTSQPPPVVAFTCIGSHIKVWLAYRERPNIFGKPHTRMVCIWSTSMRLTWGIASIHAIIMNMHFWSSRILKPKIQCSIAQISKTFQPPSTSSAQPFTKAQQAAIIPFRDLHLKAPNLTPCTPSSPCLMLARDNHCTNGEIQMPIFAGLGNPASNTSSRANAPNRSGFPIDFQFHSNTPSLGASSSTGLDRIKFRSQAKRPHGIDTSQQRTGQCLKRKVLPLVWKVQERAVTNGPVLTVLGKSESVCESDETIHPGIRTISNGEVSPASGLQSDEDEEGSGFDTSDVSSTDVSEDETDYNENVTDLRGHLTISEDDIKVWREGSLKGLTSTQIASLPALRKIFQRHTSILLRLPIQKALKPVYVCGVLNSLEYRGAAPHLIALLDFVNDRLGMNYTSLQFNINSWTTQLSQLANEGTELWELYEKDLISRYGYETAQTLHELQPHFTTEEWQELGQEAFVKLNEDDQNSTILE